LEDCIGIPITIVRQQVILRLPAMHLQKYACDGLEVEGFEVTDVTHQDRIGWLRITLGYNNASAISYATLSNPRPVANNDLVLSVLAFHEKTTPVVGGSMTDDNVEVFMFEVRIDVL
jgi:hypothetical protein